MNTLQRVNRKKSVLAGVLQDDLEFAYMQYPIVVATGTNIADVPVYSAPIGGNHVNDEGFGDQHRIAIRHARTPALPATVTPMTAFALTTTRERLNRGRGRRDSQQQVGRVRVFTLQF